MWAIEPDTSLNTGARIEGKWRRLRIRAAVMMMMMKRRTFIIIVFFFFQAEDGIRDGTVTGVQTCALPIWSQRMRRHEKRTEQAALFRGKDDEEQRALRPFAAGGIRGVSLRQFDHAHSAGRSEERRVGKECRSRWSP